MSKKSENILAKAFIEDEPEVIEETTPEPVPQEKPKKKTTTRKKTKPEPESTPTSDSPSQESLFLSLYKEHDQNLLTAVFYWCSATNSCFDATRALEAFESYTKQNHEVPYTSIYTSLIPNISFPDSILPAPLEDFVQPSPEQLISQVYQNHLDTLKSVPPAHWGKMDAANFRSVTKLLGYYPFSEQSDEDQRILCREFLDLVSEQGDEANYLRVKSALRIVLSFLHLKELDTKRRQLETEGASSKEIKEVSDIANKELTAITNFGRDAGLSERYATQKSKGANTFGGILKTMNEEHFENAAVNLYDIKTSAAIKQVAEISQRAIMEQLAFSDSQYQVLCSKQMDQLASLRAELDSANEEIRRLKKVMKTQNIIDELLEKEEVEFEDIII